MTKLAALKTINAELARLTNGFVELVKGEGYFYFIYDAVDTRNVYETKSVYCFRLRDMPGARWVAEGVDFFNEMESLP